MMAGSIPCGLAKGVSLTGLTSWPCLVCCCCCGGCCCAVCCCVGGWDGWLEETGTETLGGAAVEECGIVWGGWVDVPTLWADDMACFTGRGSSPPGGSVTFGATDTEVEERVRDVLGEGPWDTPGDGGYILIVPLESPVCDGVPGWEEARLEMLPAEPALWDWESRGVWPDIKGCWGKLPVVAPLLTFWLYICAIMAAVGFLPCAILMRASGTGAFRASNLYAFIWALSCWSWTVFKGLGIPPPPIPLPPWYGVGPPPGCKWEESPGGGGTECPYGLPPDMIGLFITAPPPAIPRELGGIWGGIGP